MPVVFPRGGCNAVFVILSPSHKLAASFSQLIFLAKHVFKGIWETLPQIPVYWLSQSVSEMAQGCGSSEVRCLLLMSLRLSVFPSTQWWGWGGTALPDFLCPGLTLTVWSASCPHWSWWGLPSPGAGCFPRESCSARNTVCFSTLTFGISWALCPSPRASLALSFPPGLVLFCRSLLRAKRGLFWCRSSEFWDRPCLMNFIMPSIGPHSWDLPWNNKIIN